jgi:hypothetical protein
MFSHHLGRALAIASAILLSACRTFTPDGGMETVASVAGSGLGKNVVRISSPADAALVRGEVAQLLHAPLGAEAAVQISLLNNPGLQAAYNRLGVAEAVAVQMSRQPLPSFAFDRVSTSIELDVERQIVASILSLATWPARSKIAGVRFEQAELRAADETLRLAAETRRAYIKRWPRARSWRLDALNPARMLRPCSPRSSPRRERSISSIWRAGRSSPPSSRRKWRPPARRLPRRRSASRGSWDYGAGPILTGSSQTHCRQCPARSGSPPRST